ncbi:hypothetical protein SDC9_33265 [bioreactor metagenome]|uniref:Uncharacterized protein n=1 Tax=bioreactor metagenome TaxID=1076179 RepID=A0A644V8A3_9ZZZZ|nr:hypothetical protein [Candidatus Elulimicrobiales bacterium]
MAGFIKDYLNNLRHSDEKTKHRSAVTISVVASVIILSILFLFFKDILFFRETPKENVQTEQTSSSVENKIESPLTSLSNFFKETGKQFSSLKTVFKDVPEILGKAEEQNSTTSTATEIIPTTKNTEQNYTEESYFSE